MSIEERKIQITDVIQGYAENKQVISYKIALYAFIMFRKWIEGGKKKTKKTHLKYIAVTVNIEGQFLLIFATQVQ